MTQQRLTEITKEMQELSEKIEKLRSEKQHIISELKLGIYHVNVGYDGYDTYDAFVVVAYNKEDALEVCRHKAPEEDIMFLGFAVDGIVRGTILGSFNAG